MILSLYRALTTAGWPLIRLYLAYRRANGKEDQKRFAERLGFPGLPHPGGRLVWIHAASVGESLSMLPLVGRLRADRSGVGVLVTTGTVTSARLMDERLPEGVFHQYVPVDRVGYVRRFLDHWHPDLALWVESEFWPNMINETAARGIPMVLVNGRISGKSFTGWQRFDGMIAKLMSRFTLCLGQTEGDAERLGRLGAPKARCVGNLKFAAPPLPVDSAELNCLKSAIDGRPIWLAASTHSGEEEIAGRVHQRLKDVHSGLLTIIVPRHPDRGPDIAAALRAAGLDVALRSAAEEITPGTDVYVADTLGELGLYYRLAGVVFIGKSLVPLGGQNPLEAARLDCALVHGPHMANFEEISHRLKKAGAVDKVFEEADMAPVIGRLLAEPGLRSRRAAAAAEIANAEAGVLDAVMAELKPFLPLECDRFKLNQFET